MSKTVIAEKTGIPAVMRHADIILEACGLCKVYKKAQKEIRAVNGITLRVKKGSLLAIIGPSGAGKSTLLHLLGGLDTPTSGKVLFDGVDMYRRSETERAQIRNERIGFVFQFYHLLPEYTVLENVLLPALIKQRSVTADKRKEAKVLLKDVGLYDRMSHKPAELSGGESQRAAIARALINRPEVLLADEPTGNLDSRTGVGIINLLIGANKKAGVSLVMVTHERALQDRSDSVIHIKDGMINDVAEGA